MRRTGVTLVAALCATLAPACAKHEASRGASNGTAPPSAEEAHAIAKEAYIYVYPMLEAYRTMYVQAVDKSSPGYGAPFNQWSHRSELLGPSFQDIVRPNNDTLYSFAWLDVRAQPVIITFPEIADRYFSLQLVDLFTHNIGYAGTRTTGEKAGSIMVTGPRWQGAKPSNVTEVVRSNSSFVYCIVRIEVRGPGDLAEVTALQQRLHLTPMNVFLGRSRVPVAGGITFPRYDERKARSVGFVDYVNLLLTEVRVPAHDEAAMERFVRIGIEPGMLSASLRYDPTLRDAIDGGIGEALVEISTTARDLDEAEGVTARSNASWQGAIGVFGSPEDMQGRYLVRAAAAMTGLFGNDAEEAYYPVANTDASGDPLDGSVHNYVIRFDEEELPPVEGFWSMTLYSLPNQLMVENPMGRYSIGDRSEVTYGPDGSLTITIQRRRPDASQSSNWLPAPDGPFSLQFRMYLPSPSALRAPLYLPPPVRKAR